MFNTKKIKELTERVERLENEMAELKLYTKCKREDKIAYIETEIKHINGIFCFQTNRTLVWLDDNELCTKSFDITEYNLDDHNEIYQNDNGEMFIKSSMIQGCVVFNVKYYKVNKTAEKLERVYFEGKKATLGKKVWG